MDKVLVVAAHPDDEALGCGGSIARHADRGDLVQIVFVADGETSRSGGEKKLSHRRDCARNAATILKARAPLFFDFPDNRLDSVPLLDIVQTVESVVSDFKPTIAYTHHGGDLNVDHRIVHQATVTALRPMPGSEMRGIFAFEVPSSTEWAVTPDTAFRPNRFIDVAAALDRKMAALACYEVEMRPFPHPRSREAINALAAWRGASAGLKAAEAFVTLRWIER